MSKKLSLAMVIALTVVLSVPSAVWAVHWSPTTFTLGRSTTTWLTPGDSFYARQTFKFTAAERTGMLAMAADGYRYTADTHDLNSNVNATGRYVTSLPSPFYDRDDDNSDNRWDEAEITAESATFPGSTAISYYAFLEYSHWYQVPPFGPWTWDSGSGSIEHNAQLSLPGCPVVCDKWDAAPLTPSRFGDYPYPSLA